MDRGNLNVRVSSHTDDTGASELWELIVDELLRKGPWNQVTRAGPASAQALAQRLIGEAPLEGHLDGRQGRSKRAPSRLPKALQGSTCKGCFVTHLDDHKNVRKLVRVGRSFGHGIWAQKHK